MRCLGEQRRAGSQASKAAPRTLTNSEEEGAHPPRPNWTHAFPLKDSLTRKFLPQMHTSICSSQCPWASLVIPHSYPTFPPVSIYSSTDFLQTCHFRDSGHGLGSLSKLLKRSRPGVFPKAPGSSFPSLRRDGPLEQWSPTFSPPGTGFMEDSFSTEGGGRMAQAVMRAMGSGRQMKLCCLTRSSPPAVRPGS